MIELTSSYFRIPYSGKNLLKRFLSRYVKWWYLVDETSCKFYLVSRSKELAKYVFNTMAYEVTQNATKIIKPVYKK